MIYVVGFVVVDFHFLLQYMLFLTRAYVFNLKENLYIYIYI